MALNPDFSKLPKAQDMFGRLPAQELGKYSHNYAPRVDDLSSVNQRFNKLKYIKDVGYWQTPEETLKRGGGDCADLAIAKYFALRKMGFNDDTMRVVVARSRSGEDHAFLTVDHDGRLHVLDNQYPDVLPDRYMDNFKVFYRMNLNGWER
jgi:predicted transglutaminase-like cysteine proteinase